MGCCYNVIVLVFFHVKKNKKKVVVGGACAHPAALHALQWSRRVLLMEAGLTFDLLSGSKSGSRGSAAGQGTIGNTREPRRKKRTTCGGVFREATQGGTQHNAGLNPCKPNTMPEYEYRVGILHDVSQSLSVAVLSEKCCNAHRGDLFILFIYFFLKEEKCSIIQRKWGQWKTAVKWVRNNHLCARSLLHFLSSRAVSRRSSSTRRQQGQPQHPPPTPPLHLLILWFWLRVWFQQKAQGGHGA